MSSRVITDGRRSCFAPRIARGLGDSSGVMFRLHAPSGRTSPGLSEDAGDELTCSVVALYAVWAQSAKGTRRRLQYTKSGRRSQGEQREDRMVAGCGR